MFWNELKSITTSEFFSKAFEFKHEAAQESIILMGIKIINSLPSLQ